MGGGGGRSQMKQPCGRPAQAVALSSDIERAQAAGFAAYWTKPLDLQRMLGELDGLLG